MRNFIIFILAIFVFAGLNAQEKSFTVKASKTTVLMDNTFKVEFILKNLKGKFEPPAFEDFIIVSGPNTSSQMSIINGETTSSMIYSYFLKPKKVGELYIENAYVIDSKDSDNNMETEPIKIISKANPDGLIEEDSDFDNRSMFNVFEWPDIGAGMSIFGDSPISRRNKLRQEQEIEKEKNDKKPKRKIKRI